MIAHQPSPHIPIAAVSMPPNDDTLIATSFGSTATITSGRCINKYVVLYGYPPGGRWRLASAEECAESRAEEEACANAPAIRHVCVNYPAGGKVRCTSFASVRLVAPDGKAVPGRWCRQCADRIVAEYAEKLGETWRVALHV